MSPDADSPTNAPEVPPRFIDPGEYGEFYWRSGADGLLRFLHCAACDRLHHPPGPVCPYCHSTELAPNAVSGRGTVVAFTVNHQPFIPGFEPPYVFAFVEIDEDPTIRASTNIVGCEPGEVSIGMRVQVTFEVNGEWHVPLFEPDSSANPDIGG